MADSFIHTLVTQSLVGAGLILLLLALRSLLRTKLRPSLVHAMWLVIALRMLLPVSLPNPILPVHQADGFTQKAFIIQTEDTALQVKEAASESTNTNFAAQKAEPTAQFQEASSQMGGENPSAPETTKRMTAAQWAMAIWISGAALSGGYMLLVNNRFIRRSCVGAVALHVSSPVPVYLAPVSSPCLVGVFRPRILFNAISIQPDNMPFALAHEICHYRNRDHIWNLLRNIMLVFYWFHPLVWIAAHCSRRDCERACDERVSRALDCHSTIAYARTLVALVTARGITPGVSASLMATTLPDMKRRINLIIAPKGVRNWACALLAGVMMLSAATSFATGEAVVKEIPMPNGSTEAPLFYPADNGLWMVVEETLYRQSDEDTFAQVAFAPAAAQIVADTANVYLFDSDRKVIRMLNFSGEEQAAWSLPEELTPIKLEIAGDKLAILSGLTADLDGGRPTAEGTLYLFDKQSGTLTQAKLGTVIDMCADGKGGLLALHVPMPGMTHALVSRLNLKSLAAQTILETALYSMGIAADAGMIYINESGRLLQHDDKTQIQTVIPLPEREYIDTLVGMRTSNGTLYAWSMSDKRLLAIDIREERSAGKTVITIINNDGLRDAYDSALKSFLLHHPDVEVRDISMPGEQYRIDLLAGTDGIDILCQAAGSMPTLAEAGALVSLSDEPSIIDALALAQWLPFEDVYAVNGKLYGIPGYVMYNLWRIDAQLAQQSGFIMPAYPFTWQDVYLAADAAGLGQAGKPALMYDNPENPCLLYYYVMAQAQKDGMLNFDTEGFREDIEAYRRMVEQGIIVLRSWEDQTNYPPSILSTFAEISDETVPTPTVNGLEIAMMQSYGYCVNINSPNRALAIELLAECLKPEHQYSSDYGYAETMLLNDSAPYSREHYDDPTWEIPRYTEHMESLRQFAAGKWVTWNTKLHSVDILANTDMLPRYLAGEIPTDEFIRLIQSRADMIQHE